MAVLVPLRWWHLPEVVALERRVFPDPWSEALFWSELAEGADRYYLAALEVAAEAPVDAATTLAGYAGLALYGDEGYIQTIAVDSARQGGGVGRALLVALLRRARAVGAASVGLEVRTDNAVAQQLYSSLGFNALGVRRGYYQPSGADALVMMAEAVTGPAYGRLLDAQGARHAVQERV
jgi:ribosomal-protein-alanine N-acetyltransferase